MNKGKGPGRNHREGITVIQLAQKLSHEEMAGYGLSVLCGRTVEYAHVAKERIHTSLHTRHFPIVAVHAAFLRCCK